MTYDSINIAKNKNTSINNSQKNTTKMLLAMSKKSCKEVISNVKKNAAKGYSQH